LKRLRECSDAALPFNIAFAERHQNSDPPYPLRLRPRSNRPRRRRAY
jgi:hypothetical protein